MRGRICGLNLPRIPASSAVRPRTRPPPATRNATRVLLGGAEWWLPVSTGPAVVQSQRPEWRARPHGPDRAPAGRAATAQSRTLDLGEEDLIATRRDGPPEARPGHRRPDVDRAP